MRKSVAKFMAYVHSSVNEMSKMYLTNERRYNYTTPKSFLEQIKLYQNLLAKKHTELTSSMERLEGGLTKLQSTAAQVDDLKEKLAAQEVELKQKNEDADALIQKVVYNIVSILVYVMSTCRSELKQRRLARKKKLLMLKKRR